ncbi:SRPBCC domain-containing protein [soil metagenome]
MTIVSTAQDRAALTLTFVVELAAPPARVWQIWTDHRQLERWWGPPTWPATFEQHDVEVGGSSRYVMTGPDGEKARGWWTFLSIDEPRSLEFEDGFSDESGAPNREMTLTSRFSSVEQMDQLAAMGMIEGTTLALGQVDAILAEGLAP